MHFLPYKTYAKLVFKYLDSCNVYYLLSICASFFFLVIVGDFLVSWPTVDQHNNVKPTEGMRIASLCACMI